MQEQEKAENANIFLEQGYGNQVYCSLIFMEIIICIEAKELMIAPPESFINYDHDYLLKRMVDEFKKKYGVECFAALPQGKKSKSLFLLKPGNIILILFGHFIRNSMRQSEQVVKIREAGRGHQARQKDKGAR